ncbi:MAG: hypothetical protein DRI89_14060 [Bacteroidetes bacterium]|nr:MAG: hypothetical protein DRI89_14060 [Bacteroidota bacterium]
MHITFIVNPFNGTVNPAKTKGFFNSFVVGNTGFPGMFFIVNEPNFFLSCMVFLKPFAPFFWCFQIDLLNVHECSIYKNEGMQIYNILTRIKNRRRFAQKTAIKKS